MAWTDPITFVSGAVLTAAQMNVIQANLLAGGPTYTTAAARDTAIPAPFEGQRAYLTAPAAATVTATGATTAVPTGITTVYNGSVWVCTTPVGAFTAALGSTTSTSYTATLSGSPGTNPSVTLPTGTTALVSIGAGMDNSSTSTTIMSVAVSGAGSVAASDDYYLAMRVTAGLYYSSTGITFVLPGLTAGINTFTLNYRVTGSTGNYERRRITVTGIA